jgi:hypothetical protein
LQSARAKHARGDKSSKTYLKVSERIGNKGARAKDEHETWIPIIADPKQILARARFFENRFEFQLLKKGAKRPYWRMGI